MNGSVYMGGEGIRRKLVLSLVSLLVIITPIVDAGSRIEAPGAIVLIEDKHRTCDPLQGQVCHWTLSGNDTSDLTLDTYQRIQYVGVATDLSALTGDEYAVLPDQSLFIDGDAIFVTHPGFIILTSLWNRYGEPLPIAGVLDVEMSNVSITVASPLLFGEKDYGVTYAPEGRGVGYDQLGPYNAPTGSSTDNYARQVQPFCPLVQAYAPCVEATDAYHREYKDVTPNVIFGLEFYSVEYTTNASEIGLSAPARASADPDEAVTRVPIAENPEPVEETETAEGAAPDDAPSDREDTRRKDRRGGTAPPIPTPPPTNLQTSEVAAEPPLGPVAVVALTVSVAALVAALVGAYSRFANRDEVLESPVRKAFIDFIRDHPGSMINAVAAHLKLTRTAAEHHARLLERGQLLKVLVEDGRRYLFLPSQCREPRPDAPHPAPPLHPLKRSILRIVAQAEDGVTRSGVHSVLADVPKRTCDWTIRKLLEEGSLVESRLGGRSTLHVGPAMAFAPRPGSSQRSNTHGLGESQAA